ncbi:hypothetical protein [Brevibacillus sp. NRS-1366]|uniref:hypothetical protein n=1 Tax=Brevibacillus sp. NRS-1366 TaxID=3233899 RepID=UPI003D1EB48A
MAKVNEIYMSAKLLDDKDNVVISRMDFSYLIRMATALEQINAVQQRVYNGEIDGLDFATEVEGILERT